MPSLSPISQKVQDDLINKGFEECSIITLPSSAKTAQMAADSLGCSVAQIAKSLVFQGKTSKKLFLVIASGVNRVNTDLIAQETGEDMKFADPEIVLKETGFVVGGIPPIGHTTPLPTYIDRDLLSFSEIWAAGGEAETVFKLTPEILLKITEGKVIDIH